MASAPLPIGGTRFIEHLLLNKLRQYMTDPGVDDPNVHDGTGHGTTRETAAAFSATGDGAETSFTITPAVSTAPVVSVYSVQIAGVPKAYGLDYLITWGDKFGPNASKTTSIDFFDAPADAAAITATYKYGKQIKTLDGKQQALGSWINSGFSRGAMPNPKIQLLLENDVLEEVGVGDNWDSTASGGVGRGAVWHNCRWRALVFSLFADECKTICDSVVSSVMRISHENNYLTPVIRVEEVINLDYDFEQKAFIRAVMLSCKSREIF